MLLWEKKGTDDVIAQLEQIQSAEERLKMLMHSALQNTEHLKIEGILAAAAICKSEGIWGIYQRVDSRRRQYVDSLYQEMGLAPKEAQLWGQLAYSTYLGALLTESTKTLSSAPKKDAQHLKKKMPKKEDAENDEQLTTSYLELLIQRILPHRAASSQSR